MTFYRTPPEIDKMLSDTMLELDRLRSENAELRAALEYIATGGEDWNDCARKARATLERTKK